MGRALHGGRVRPRGSSRGRAIRPSTTPLTSRRASRSPEGSGSNWGQGKPVDRGPAVETPPAPADTVIDATESIPRPPRPGGGRTGGRTGGRRRRRRRRTGAASRASSLRRRPGAAALAAIQAAATGADGRPMYAAESPADAARPAPTPAEGAGDKDVNEDEDRESEDGGRVPRRRDHPSPIRAGRAARGHDRGGTGATNKGRGRWSRPSSAPTVTPILRSSLRARCAASS